MKRPTRARQGKPSLELLEEAVHLLRTGPASALAAYYAGALPFVLGLLWFWTDMSRSPFAPQRLEGAALGLALLFIWMKFWQMIFARALRASIIGDLPPLTFVAGARLLAMQAMLHAIGLFLVPLSLVFVLPFPWVFASYQNFCALGGSVSGPGELLKRSFRQASLWPRQNLGVLAAMAAFGFIVFLNWATFGYVLPSLLKMLLGIESVFTRGGTSLLNSTFFAAIGGLTYLCVDPLLKTSYLLRCFYGESLQSGEDLRAELKQWVSSQAAAAASVLMLAATLLIPGSPLPSRAASLTPANNPPAQPGPAAVPPGLPAAELDHTIQDVTRQPKYTWRMPRTRIVETETESKGVLGRFLERAFDFIERCLKAVGRWLDRLFRRAFQGRRQTSGDGSGYGWVMLLQVLFYALIAATAATLAVLILRVWQGRQRKKPAVASEPVRSALDLTDENLGPEQLPEDGWKKLAMDLMARGELRLALRALYLSSLAHLAQRNLISLARFKSNRDYERELGRRGHALPALVNAFGENVSVFERIWYGRHEVNGEQVERFATNVEHMRRAA